MSGTEHHIQQPLNAHQGPSPTVYPYMVNHLPASHCGEQAPQPQNVVQVAMREQNGVQPTKAQPTDKDLALRALPAVNHKPLVPVHEKRG